MAVRSPTLTLLGATWASGVVTNHYLITFAAALALEPPVRASLAHLRALGSMSWFERIGWQPPAAAHQPPPAVSP